MGNRICEEKNNFIWQLSTANILYIKMFICFKIKYETNVSINNI